MLPNSMRIGKGVRLEYAYLNPHVSTINPLEVNTPIDLHKQLKRKNIERVGRNIVVASTDVDRELPKGEVLDVVNWLPAAADPYHISGDIRDYILVPVPTVPSEFPNRNGVGFPLDKLVQFDPEMGMLAYKTWKGKPTHFEHRNNDITQAKGVIADAILRRMQDHGDGRVYKLTKLLMFDRTKDPDLVRAILAREINSYSMGAMVGGYECSYCGNDLGRCSHVNPRRPLDFYLKDGHLVYRRVKSIRGFETSAVSSPAWQLAISDELLDTSLGNKARLS